MAEPNFTPIDLQTWPRGQMFYYFSKMAPTGYSLTVSLDVTEMRKALKSRGKKFFPAYLWLVTKLLNRQTEFKVAYRDEVLGFWDTLTPLYAAFHEDDKTISFLWTEYCDSFSEFHSRYTENAEKSGDNHGVLAQPDQLPPPNSYTVSCVPWISFEHFSIHSNPGNPYFFPSVEAGKFYEKDGRTMMPFSLTVNHATTDGYHVHTFLEELQHEMNRPEGWLN
jgi:Chloramphenicol O-acetyltransferase